MNSELKYVTIDELKMQMRVDFDEEDDLIKMYGLAAEDSVLRGTQRTDEELLKMGYEERNGEEAKEEVGKEWFPTRLKCAIMLMAAHLYRNREAVAGVAQNVVPYGFNSLVKPYRKLSDRA
jgi:uncharacterized phage protein (predicted DNA packaging)